MIFRLTAPNWERLSPYYGSHIIMSISGIYLLISIHTLYHSLSVLSLSLVHEITYFHDTLRLLKYTSAAFSSLAPTDDSRRTLSIYTMFFYRRRYASGQLSVASLPTGICILISWTLVGGQAAPSVFELGHRRRALHLPPAAQSGPQCAGPTTFPSKYSTRLFENNKFRQVT